MDSSRYGLLVKLGGEGGGGGGQRSGEGDRRCGRNLLWWDGPPPPALMLGLVLFVIAPSPRVWPAKGERVCRWAFRALVTQLMWEVWLSRPHIRSLIDTLAEWLRRRPAKPMGSPRVGSNPTGVDMDAATPPAASVFRISKGTKQNSARWGGQLFKETRTHAHTHAPGNLTKKWEMEG